MRRLWRSTDFLPSSTVRGTAAVVLSRPAAPRTRLFGQWAAWLLLAPALVPLVGLVLVPYAGALLYSLTGATLADITSPPLVGLKNFGAVAGSTRRPTVKTTASRTGAPRAREA